MSNPITAKMVNDLRVATGAGLLDCKKALTEANGNIEEASTILRKKGAASAAKKADRDTKEGPAGGNKETNQEFSTRPDTPDYLAG